MSRSLFLFTVSNVMQAQVTSIVQSQRLLAMGVPSRCASFCHVSGASGEGASSLRCSGEATTTASVPAFSVCDLLQMLPDQVEGSWLQVTKRRGMYEVSYKRSMLRNNSDLLWDSFEDESLINVLFRMAEYLIMCDVPLLYFRG